MSVGKPGAQALGRGDPYAVVEWGMRWVPLRSPTGQLVPGGERVEAPLSWSRLAVATVAQHYFGRMADGMPERSVKTMVRRVVEVVGRWAQNGGQVEGAQRRRELEATLTALVLSQRATFATPVWLNVGLEPEPLTSACFILETDDSIKALLDWNAREGLIFQQGGGAGINLSKVRSSREPVSRGGLASGPVSFMRAADAWAGTIRSGGRARRGAKMVVLDADHPDVLEFIACKAIEEERGAALLAAGYSPGEVVDALAFQHATHAVRASDELMLAAEQDREWELRAVTTGEVLRRLPARELLRACAKAAWRCGDPGLQFSSTVNAWHTCPCSGPITASNPCGEFLHVGESACNLSTLNLLAFQRATGFDVERFTSAVEHLVSAQDAIVDGSAYPTQRIAEGAHRFRQIGIGCSNLAATLLALGIAYDSDGGRAHAAALTALMSAVAYRRSAELAMRLGPFAEFEANREPMLSVLARHRRATEEIGRDAPRTVIDAARREWDQVLALGARHGFRNAQTTLIAPTGTVSLMLDCESTGVEPHYAFATHVRFADGGEARLESRVLSEGLLALGYSTPAIEQLCEYASDHGDLAGAPGLRDQDRVVVQTTSGPRPLSAEGHLRMVAAVQPLLSGGVSKTLNLPEHTSPEEIEQTFMRAWRLGLKSISVYRQGSKIGQPLLADELD